MNVRGFALWATASAAAGVVVLVLALLLGGGAPPPSVPGLTSPSPVALWGGDVASYAALLAGVIAVGFGVFGERGPAGGAAAAWTAVSALQVGLLAWEQHGQSTTATAQGQALLVQGGLAAMAAFGWSVGVGRWLTLVALAGLVPPSVVGHARAADARVLATAAIVVHVLAAAVWVGGLLALALIDEWRTYLGRYSTLALASASAVALSGTLAALQHVSVGDVFGSRYGALVALKAVILLGLAGAGWLQRRHVVTRPSASRRAFVMLAGFELTTMVIVMALASALADTPPPA